MEISKKTNISELIAKHPETAEILSKAGLGCIGCVMAQFETIEQGCRAHGLSDKEVNELIKKIKNHIKT